jgi:hypothetical protein
MSLITAHRILIGTAVVFFVFFGVWQLAGFRASGEGAALVQGLVSLAVAAGFAAYFRTIRERYGRGGKGPRVRGS